MILLDLLAVVVLAWLIRVVVDGLEEARWRRIMRKIKEMEQRKKRGP